MGNIYKTSRAVIRPVAANDRFVYLLESENPEIKLSKAIRDFLQTVGYSQLFPNFDNIRVGTTHPFAILLSQEVLGQDQNTNVFPSITVVDSTMQEDADVVGDEYTAAVWKAEDIAAINGYRESGEVFCSDAGWAEVQEKITEAGFVIGITKQYHTNHNIDFNIWSENKEVTSFLFDMVSHFVIQKKVDLHNIDGYDLTNIQGRRSGDINLDFGRLLYGANLTTTLGVNHRATMFDTALNNLTSINTQTLPKYFTLGAV